MLSFDSIAHLKNLINVFNDTAISKPDRLLFFDRVPINIDENEHARKKIISTEFDVFCLVKIVHISDNKSYILTSQKHNPENMSTNVHIRIRKMFNLRDIHFSSVTNAIPVIPTKY